tara:strand:- start:1294 stop:1470 length:177 start_codon:yes stop_codon:yes gene_type:complete
LTRIFLKAASAALFYARLLRLVKAVRAANRNRRNALPGLRRNPGCCALRSKAQSSKRN